MIESTHGTYRYEKGDVNLDPIASALRERGCDALTVRDATGIALPKVLRLLGLSSLSASCGGQITGYEAVQLAAFAEVPLSALLEGGEGE